MTDQRKDSIPDCPKCQVADHSEEEEQSGSSARWFICRRCGFAYAVPLRSSEPSSASGLPSVPPGQRLALVHADSAENDEVAERIRREIDGSRTMLKMTE